MHKEKTHKRFSIRKKLLTIFGTLIFVAGFTLAFLGVRIARKAVIEKIETHLKDKATDTAEILDGRIHVMFQFLEGIARMPFLYNTELSYSEKIQKLSSELEFNTYLKSFYIVDTNGTVHFADGTSTSYAAEQGFKEGMKGKTTMESHILMKERETPLLQIFQSRFMIMISISSVFCLQIWTASGFPIKLTIL